MVDSDLTKLVLASGSPRRQQLLQAADIEFVVEIPALDEEHIGQTILDDGGSPTDYVTALAEAKVSTATGSLTLADSALVLAADTVVVHRGRILGKPANRNEARATVLGMSGHSVEVITAVALGDGTHTDLRVVSTTLAVRALSPAEVHRYVATGAADDKAGSLAVQDEAADFITAIDGCFTNVVGLPMCEVADLLRLELSPQGLGPRRALECLCPTAS